MKTTPGDNLGLSGGRASTDPDTNDPAYLARYLQCRQDCDRLPKMALRDNYKAEATSHRSRKHEAKRERTNFAPELEDFAEFLRHVGPMPCPGMTLDRRDNTRGYELGNVRWASAGVQNNNRSNSLLLRHSETGKEFTATDLAKRQGTSVSAIYKRLNRDGWSHDEVIDGKRRRPLASIVQETRRERIERPPTSTRSDFQRRWQVHCHWLVWYIPWASDDDAAEETYQKHRRPGEYRLPFAIRYTQDQIASDESRIKYGSPAMSGYHPDDPNEPDDPDWAPTPLTPEQEAEEAQRVAALRHRIQVHKELLVAWAAEYEEWRQCDLALKAEFEAMERQRRRTEASRLKVNDDDEMRKELGLR